MLLSDQVNSLLSKIIYFFYIAKFNLKKKIFFNNKYINYNNLYLNKFIIKKTKQYFSNKKFLENLSFNEMRTYIFSTILEKKNFCNILDFGGGSGYHYFLVKKFLKRRARLIWNIVENKTMVNLHNNKKNNQLIFFDSISKIKNKIEIIFSSCAINYCEDTEKTLYDLMKFPCKYYYFTRIPLSLKKNLKFNQYSMLSENGPGQLKAKKEQLVKVNNSILKKAKFENIIKKFCKIEFSFKDEDKSFFYKEKIGSYTYFLIKKKKYF